jgi:hypothetical protein
MLTFKFLAVVPASGGNGRRRKSKREQKFELKCVDCLCIYLSMGASKVVFNIDI